MPRYPILVLLLTLALAACDGSGGDGEGLVIDDTPEATLRAIAGLDQDVNEGEEVILSGSSEVSDANLSLSYSWEQISGSPVELFGADSQVASFSTTVDADTNLSFRLLVQSQSGLEATDDLLVSVNNAPTAIIEGVSSVAEGVGVTLNGWQSLDSEDGSIVAYDWLQVAGANVALYYEDQATVSFAAPSVAVDENLSFELVVTDDDGAVDRSTAIVEVLDDSDNPSIAAVYLSPGIYGISDNMIITLEAVDAENGLSLQEGSNLNGQELTDFAPISGQDGNYTAIYTVADNNPSQDDGASVSANIVLVDPAGNASAAITEIQLDGVSIDTLPPSVNNITVGAGAHAIGAEVEITIAAVSTETNLSLRAGSTFNGQELTDFAAVDGLGGYYTAIYTVTSGDPDLSSSAEANISIVVLDLAGNESPEYTIATLGDSASVDANPPAVSSVDVSSGAYGIGDDIRISIIPVDVETDLTISPNANSFNGRALSEFVHIDSGVYSAVYTVTEGDGDVADNTSADINIALVDAYGNVGGALTSTLLSNSSIDSTRPQLSVLSISDGVYRIGSKLAIYLRATEDEVGLQLQDSTFNGSRLTGFSDLQNGFYALTYTVVAGDSDRADGAEVDTNITLADPFGNDSLTITTVTLDGESIDANAPVIESISVGEGIYLIGDELMLYISADDSDLILKPGSSFNGQELSDFQPIAGQDGNYSAIYTVVEDDPSVDVGDSAVSNIALLDAAGNESETISSVNIGIKTSIGAKVINITDISASEGFYVIGDSMILTITTLGEDPDLVLKDGSSFNGQPLTNFTPVAGADGVYQATYIVADGNPDIAAGGEVSIDIILADTAGNESERSTSLTLAANTSIDANSPIIDSVSVAGGNHGIGAVVEIVLSTSGDETDFTLAEGSTFNGQELTGFSSVDGEDGDYVVTYTVVEGDNYVADGSSAVAYIALVDASTNLGAPTQLVPLVDAAIDADRPEISAISAADGEFAIGYDIALTLTVVDSDTELTLSSSGFNGGTVNGLSRSGDGIYNTTYTVSEGDADIAIGDEFVTDIALVDSAGNVGASFQSLTSLGTSVDANSPIVASIIVEPGVYKIGDNVSFTITASNNEAGLILTSSDTFNGDSRWSVVDTGDGNYSGVYKVEEGDPDVAAGGTVGVDISFTDSAGNDGPRFTAVDLDPGTSIDANSPGVASISVAAGSYGIGDVAVLTITASNNETGLSLDNGSTFNDEQLTDIVDKLDGNYSANYTVVEGNRYVAEGAPITINIFFTDPSGNISPAQQSITPSGVSIEAERPTIETVSVAQGVYKVGDEVTLTIVAGDDENDLSLKSGSSFNGSELHSFRADDDLNGVYTAIYTPSFDDDGITAGATVSADIALVDTFGNASAAVTELELDDTSVDTTPPSIYDVLVDGDNVINGADDLTVIFVEGSTSGVENQYQATLNVGGVETLALINSDGDIGSFNTTVDLSELPDGTHTIIVEAADAAGNPARSESEFIIDTEAPIVEQLLIAGDNKINAAEAALELLPVEGTIAGAEEGQIISLTIDEVAAEASVDSVGDFMVDVDLSSLSDDITYIVTATVSDAAGNSRDYFSTFEKDTVIPTIDSVTVADDDVINLAEANAVEINGTTTGVEDDQVVSIVIFAGLEASKDTKANVTDNKFNATFYLTDFDDSSSINLIADVSDAAGNPAKQFAKINIVKDTIAPSISSISLDTGAHKVGTTVGITITAYADESGLTFASTIFNGQNLDEITDNNDGTYTSSYTVVEGDPDVAAGGAVAVDLAFTSDAAGNAGIDITYVDLGDDTSIDANSPSIADISVAEGAHIVGATVELNITASNNEPGLTLSSKTFNGKELGAVTDNGDGNYTTSYTVEEGDNDIAAGGIVDVNLAFSDSSNNTGTAITSVSLASGTSIDANSPSIADISVAAGTHKVGSVVELNITATNNEPGLTLSSKTFNGQELGDVIDNGDGNYTTRYTVEEGDNDIAAGGSVDVNLAFSDSSDNTGTAITSVTLASGTSIDANSPTIANVSVAEGIHKVGSVVELNITASNNEPGLTLSSKTFNGKELGAVIDNGDGNYTASYTVEEGDNDIVAGGSVDVNLAFSDSSNNTGTATTSVSLTSGTSIDANSPSIDSVSVEAGTHKVGDEVEVVITETNNETGLTLSSNTFNGAELAVGAASDGIYTFTYTVIETNTDVVDGGDVTVNLAFSDSSGNTGTATTSVSLTSSTSIDANSPQQTVDDIAISDDTGTLDYDFLTNNPTQTITATLSAALGNDEFLFGSVSSNSEGDPIWDNITDKVSDRDISWSTTLSSGSNDIQLKVMDTAGNDGDIAEQAYTLDTTPPEINTSGTDTEVDEASPATLNANASNDSNGIASYAWAQVESDGTDLQDSTALTIDDTTTASTTVSTPGITDDDGADLSFYFAVTITDKAGNSATSPPLTLTVSNTYTTPDITASTSAPNFDQLSLSWATTDGLTYDLHRSTSSTCDLISNCADYQLYASVNLSSGAQIDTGLDFFTPYYYWLETHFGSTLVALSSTPTEANTTGPALNDTGVTKGGDYPSGFDTLSGTDTACNGGYLESNIGTDEDGNTISNDDNGDGDAIDFIAFDNEDCELGRDATNNDDSDGHAGFSYTRLNADGSEYSGSGDYTTEPWSCVVDNVTGLIWEVKTTDGGTHDANTLYTWYSEDGVSIDDKTFHGTEGDGTTPNTQDLIDATNTEQLCGQSNWRLPSATEMVSLRNNSVVGDNFPTDSAYLPNFQAAHYWTSSVNHFANGDGDSDPDTYPLWNIGPTDLISWSGNGPSSRTTRAILVSSSSTSADDYFNDWSDDRYDIHTDGTVSDKRTGLMWMRCGYDTWFSFYESANDTCVESNPGQYGGTSYLGAFREEIKVANDVTHYNNIGGYTDWRLPNLTELFSLFDHTAGDADTGQALINPTAFPNAEPQFYRSSTPSANGNANYYINFSPTAVFAVGLGGIDNGFRIRLVRADVKTPRILTLNINGDNVINTDDIEGLGTIPVSGSTADVEGGQQLTLAIGTTTFDIEIADDGSFAATIDLSTIADNTYTVTADVSDIYGKAANQYVISLTKDIQSPSISEVVVSTDNIINSTEAIAATITGSTIGVEDEQILSLAISDGTTIVQQTIDITEDSFTITDLDLSTLADSTNLSLTADVADAVGNAADQFTNSSITKDTAAPTIDITSVATDDTINASETSAAEIIGTTTGAENGQTVSLAITDATTTVEATTTVTDNSYTAKVDLTSLADSTSTTSLTLGVAVADIAGNQATASQDNIIKDTKAPSILSISVTDDDVVNSSEILNPVTVSGTTSGVEDNQFITLTIGTITETTPVANDNFSTTIDLSTFTDAIYDLNANVADIAGNPVDESVNFEIDTTAPTQAVNLGSISFSIDTGTADDDLITNQAEQTISAELNATLGTGDVLYASIDGGTSWSKIYAGTNLTTTSFSWAVTLPNGTNVVQFQVADSYDNNGSLISTDYTLDTTKPTQTISAIKISDDSGTTDDFLTNIADQTITATLSAALGTDEFLFGSFSSNSEGDPIWDDITTSSVTDRAISWDITFSAGENNIQFKVMDAAGNDGAIASETYTLDQTAPTIDTAPTATTVVEGNIATLDASASSDSSGIASYTWTQVASDGASELPDTDANYVVLTSAADGTATFTAPGIANDTDPELSFYFAVTITDTADNTATSSPLAITVTNDHTTPAITASASAPNFDQLSLSWTTTTGLAYDLHRSSAADCDLSATGNCADYELYAAVDLSGGAQIDSGLELFTPYYYWLEAELNGEVVSLSSAPLEANTTGPALNDTGITGGGDYPSGFDSLGDGTACNGGYLVDDNGDVISDPDNHSGNSTFVPFAAEDCELGRDADDTLNDDSDGKAGFSFTRLNSDGSEYSGDGVYSEQPWACVVDNVTGLIWEVKTTTTGNASYYDQGYTWEGASTTLAAYLNGDNFNNTDGSGLCGRTDWRLPTVQEIHGLTDYAATSAPFIDTGYFPHTLNYFYWTVDDNADPALSEDVWAYNPSNAEIVTRYTNNSSYARLVSSSEAVESHFSDYSDNRYTDHGDGTISDTKTGLMWMKCTYGQNYDSDSGSCTDTDTTGIGDWQAAFANAAESNSANSGNGTFAFVDWRLPNIKELGSLVDFSKSAGINTNTFPIFNDEATYYWSSTPTIVDNTPAAAYDQAVTIGFGTEQGGRYVGVEREITNSFAVHLRLVRDDVKTPRIITLNINGNNIITADDSNNLGAISVSGTTADVEDGQKVSLNIGGISAEIEVSSDSFTATIDLSNLDEGTAIAVTADVSDQTGKEANQFNTTLIKDTAIPSISEVIVAEDNTINFAEANSVTITGTTSGVEDGQNLSLAISDGTNTVAQTTIVTGNAFTITALNLSNLADGTNLSLTADVADAVGNDAATYPSSIIKDTAAPTIAITSVATDNTINASEVNIAEIIGTTSGAENGQTVSLSITDGTTIVDTTATISNNSYSTTVNLSGLADSTSLTLDATVADAAGNEASTNKTNIIKDTVAPSILSVLVAGDNFVNSSELTKSVAVSGTTSGVEDGQQIFITIEGPDPTATVTGNSFTTTANLDGLGDGTKTVTANVADAAGNPADEFIGSYEVDITAPTQAVNSLTIELSADTGTYPADFLTNEPDQTIGAELNATLGDGDVLYASVNGGSTWQKVDSSSISDTSISWDTTLLVGTSSIQFQVADAADNNGTLIEKDYTLDTTPPEQSISGIALTPDTGVLSDDFITTTNGPDPHTITATLSPALDTGDVLWGAISLNSAGDPDWIDITGSVTSQAITWETDLSTGENDIQLKVEDAAGNSGEIAEQNYTFDNLPPTIDITGTTSNAEEASDATLDAANSSDNYDIASYEWTQVQSDSSALSDDDIQLTIANANDATTTVSTPGIADDDISSLSFYFSLRITDVAGNGAGIKVTLIVDNTHTTPTITANPVGAPDFNQISLSWSADTSLNYSIYRSTQDDCDLSNYTTCTNPALYTDSTGITISDTSIASVTDTDSSDSFQLFNSYYYWLGAQIGTQVVSLSSTPIEATTSGPVLNDTGITGGGDYPSGFDNHNGLSNTCDGGYLVDDQGAVIADPSTYTGTTTFVGFVDEDCELGRDANATLNDDSDGNAAFVFTKLDINGNALEASATDWSCVLDHTTGLIWEVKTTDGTWRDRNAGFTWYDSDLRYGENEFNGTESDQDTEDFIEYVKGDSSVNNGNGLCGQTDWRLPTVHEIEGLADYDAVVADGSGGYSTPSIDTDYFPYATASQYQWYWTSHLNVDPDVNGLLEDDILRSSTSNYYAWSYGSAESRTRSGTGSTVGYTGNYRFVRLVSSSAAVASHFSDYSNNRYTDNGDGTISDAQTGLMWMQCSYGQTYDGADSDQDDIICEGSPASGNWQQAFAWAADSNANSVYNYSDWRLPNIKELGSIVDFGSAKPAINQSIFPNTASGPYWSSTPSRANVHQAIFIGFQAGDYGPSDRISNLYLRLVRDDVKTPRILTVNISDDNIINASDSANLSAIPVSGTTNDVEAGRILSLSVNNNAYSTSAEIQADGSFTTTIDLTGIADGTHPVTANVSDINEKPANQFTGSFLVDTVAPTIDSVSATAGIYGIDASVPLSITAAEAEIGLTLSSNTFNGATLGEVIDNNNGTYTTSYTVIENDADIATGGTVITELAFTDPAGNPGAATESITLSGASIDANRPTITSVSIPTGAHGIGAQVPLTLTAGANETDLTFTSITFNGATLAAPTDNKNGTYTTTYTVEEGDPDVASGEDVSVNLAFTDPAGNSGTAFESVTLPTGTSIDATAPTQTISDIDISDDSGASDTDFLTKESDQTISATLSPGLETGDTLQGSVDSGNKWDDITTSVNGTAITWNSVTLTSGSIQFKVVDAAGNDGDVAEQPYTLDTTAPTIDTTGTDSTADEGSSASLDASNSSDSNGIASYSWTQVASDGNALADSSTALAITNAESATASVIAPGIIADTDPDLSLYFAVTVTDEAGNDATSSPLTLTVTNAYKTPTITASTNASFDQISLSWDTDTNLIYSLYRSTDSNCDLSNYNNACTNSTLYTDNTGITISGTTASVTDDGLTANTIYYYWLEARLDSEVVSLNTDPIQVATTPPPGVNAGIANSQAIGTLASLRGSATADPGKTIASYLWEETTSHGITIDRADTANASFTVPDNLVVGDVLSFQLTAIDSDGARTSATTSITIAKPGSQKWYFGVGDGYGVKSSPAIGADGTVYFGAEDKNLYALNPQNGSLKWSFPTGAAIKTPPAIDANGTVYFASDDTNLYAVSAPADGTQLGVEKWRRSVGTIYSAHTSVSIAADGTLYYVSSDKSFYALNPADGNALWSSGHSGDVSMTKPAISPSGTIYFASGGEDGTIFAIDPSSGVGNSRDSLWEFATGSYLTDTSPAIGADGSVYNGGWNNDKLYALDSNGNEKWDYGPSGDVRTSPAIAADGTIYFGSRGKSLFALDSNADGYYKWDYSTGGNVDSSPVIGADGTVYVGSDDFNVYAFVPDDIDPDNVDPKWSITTNGKVSFSSAALAPDGTLFIGSADGLYAIHTASAGLQAASPWPKFGQNNRNSGRVNLAPTANAGDDQTVSAGATVTLNASASTDTDGNIIDYYWRETSGYGISITNNNSAQASFTAPNYGNDPITIELTVTDDHAATTTTTHTITIN